MRLWPEERLIIYVIRIPFELNTLVAPLEAVLSSLPTTSDPHAGSSPTSAEGAS